MTDTKVSALAAASAPSNADLFVVDQGGTSKQMTWAQILAAIPNPAALWTNISGADTNSTVTPAAVTNLKNAAGDQVLGIGTYTLEALIPWKTQATGTGIQFYLNHTGTASRVVANFTTLTSGGAAATGVADQSTTATAQLMEGKGQRANNSTTGAIQGVDTADTIEMTEMRALITVTASGNLQLMFNSEVGTSLATVMQGILMRVTKYA